MLVLVFTDLNYSTASILHGHFYLDIEDSYGK